MYREQSPELRELTREAFVLLARFRAATLLFKFKYLTRSVTHSAQAVEPPLLSGQSQQLAGQIGYIVTRVGRNTPWKSPCLVQVLTVQHMLAARSIPGIFYLGVRKNKVPQPGTTEMGAHAWLKCGNEIINGGDGHEVYTVVSSWSW